MDITQLSLIKSSTGVARLFAEELKNNILNSENEELASSPASFVSLLLSGIGDLSANSFLEQQMIKREMHKSTAIKLQSLLRYLSDSELAGIFANPSTSTFFIAFPYNLLLSNAIVDPSLGTANIKKVRINKDSSIILMNKTIFILDHSINILILDSESSNPTFNVSYDLSDKYSDSFSSIVNPYISTRIFNYSGTKYLGFEIVAREYERSETILNINTDSMGDQLIEYDNQLMGFEVLYKDSTSDSYQRLIGYPEGIDPVDGYNYSLVTKNSSKYVKIAFSKSENDFNVGTYSTLKIIVYTTTGSVGNISFPDIDQDLDNNIQFVLKADSTNVFEQAIATLTPLVTTRSVESTGGKDQMSFEDIRTYVINKSSNNLTVTPSELEKKASDYNCSIEKIRHDVLALIYRLSTTLKNSDNDYISSGMGVFRFNLDDIKYRSEIKSRILKPSSIFKYNSNDTYYHYQNNPVSLKDYLFDYKLDQNAQVSFPYFLQMYFNSSVLCKIFDMASDQYYFTEIDYYDEYALDTVNIEKANVYRNPSIEKPTDEELENGIEGLYTISFNAIVGQNMFNLLQSSMNNKEENLPLKFKLLINDTVNGNNYFTNCTITELNPITLNVRIKATLVTNNNVNEDGNLCINQNSLIPLPIPLIYETFFYINPSVNMKILVMYNSETMYGYRNKDYDQYLTTEEKNAFYYISTVYDLGSITLLKNITNKFNFSLDIKLNDTTYETYDTDQYMTYSETEYEKDENNQIIYEITTTTNDIGTAVSVKTPKVLHAKGDIIKDESGNPKVKYKAGTIKYVDGKPIEKKVNSYYCLIKTVPWFDRLYNIPNQYFNILNAYNNLIDTHTAISQTIVDGVELSLGFKKTYGQSSLYQILNKNTEKYESLNNLALSFSFGVAFSSILSQEDKNYNVENIVSKTKEYIYNFSGDILSISDLFIYLKNSIPSIDYLEFYSVNNYDPNQCQSIHKDTSAGVVENETLCIKMDIDEENSDFNNGILNFVPAINVKVL